MAIRILTANIYVNNPTPGKAADKIKDLNPHGMALQEASGSLEVLTDKLGDYRLTYYAGGKQGKNTIAGVLKSLGDSYGTGTMLGCTGVDDTTCGKARWMDYSITQFAGGNREAMIATHFNCNVQHDDGTANAGRMLDLYKTHSGRLVDLIKAFQGIGWYPIVGADFNYRLKGKIDTAEEAPDWSPYGIARQCGLKYICQGIDGILFDPDVFRLDHTQRIPQEQTGSDHDWFMAFLEVK